MSVLSAEDIIVRIPAIDGWIRDMPGIFKNGNAPAVQKMSRERAGTDKERLYPLHKGHTTQVTASKPRQNRLKSPGTPAL
ncbi:hypothetical protein TNCV_4889021 [Trichonephila clavipes]|nr:hypothetical protein TNCV_4889021 [Trichonephila clavipes]